MAIQSFRCHDNFFHLCLDKGDIIDCACESMIYYFDNKVNWTDFLATSIISQPQKYIKEGILIAYFASVDQGADYWFECSKDYKENVLILLRTLTALGCRVKQVSHLSFPYN